MPCPAPALHSLCCVQCVAPSVSCSLLGGVCRAVTFAGLCVSQGCCRMAAAQPLPWQPHSCFLPALSLLGCSVVSCLPRCSSLGDVTFLGRSGSGVREKLGWAAAADEENIPKKPPDPPLLQGPTLTCCAAQSLFSKEMGRKKPKPFSVTH